MSGIAGIVRPGGGASAALTLRAMARALPVPPEAPEQEWLGEHAALVVRPLHSTALTGKVSQPPVTAKRDLTIVFDGYLANPDALRAELAAHGLALHEGGDAELVLQAYRAWGSDCPRRIEGEFAFAIWDEAQGELFCARDHQGLRPFYYYCDGAQFAFGSGVAAVLAALARDPLPNRGYMAEIMADRWYSVDETVWQEVRRLSPAHSLRLAGGKVHLARYWSLDTAVTIRYRRDEDYFAHYRELFADCVRRAARSDAPLAVEVSGGLDSSAVFGMAHVLEQRGELGAPALRGYSLFGPAGSAADERSFVAAVARHTGRPVTEVALHRPSPDWFAAEARRHRDIANYPNGAMALDLDRRIVADGCRVKLTGQGGDQWLDGSRRYYREAVAAADWRGLAAGFSADLRDQGPAQTAELLLRGVLTAVLPERLMQVRRERRARMDPYRAVQSDWLSPELRQELDRRELAYRASFPRCDSDRYKLEKLQFPFLMLVLELVARQSGELGLEVRHPMLSRRFIEFSAATPDHIRLRGVTGKFVHRRALAGFLPPEVAARRSKGEFSVTFDGHAEAIARSLAEAGDILGPGMLDPEGVRRLLTTYCGATIDEAPYWELWGIYLVLGIMR